MRTDGRNKDQIRSVKINPEAILYAEGSVLIEMGNTKVMCTASVDQSIPKWLQGQGRGWVTAEYGMLPRSTHTRMNRAKTATGGRTQEISRLIGRSLRAAVDLEKLGERQIQVDCDVIQADGGTRTAAVTGGFVALAMCMNYMKEQKMITSFPLKHYISAISVGLSNDGPLLDLNYDEDSTIETDMNFVLNDGMEFIEIQGTAEGSAFSRDQMNQMLDFAQIGCQELFKEQEKHIGSFFKLNR